MSLEKESLTHKIEDDLALRNRNWDKLTSHLADMTNPHDVTAKQVGAITYGKMSPRKIITGGGSYNLNVGDNSFQVTFPEEFSSSPFVFVNVHTSNPNARSAAATGPTTTGFTLHVYSSTAGSNIYVSWIAMGGA